MVKKTKIPARELEACIIAHPAIAQLVLSVLKDDDLALELRAPIVAAARYGCEDYDLIQDDVPCYGLIDDLFILAIGLDTFFKRAGEASQKYQDTIIGDRSAELFIEFMKNFFYGFWEYCRQNTEQFFTECDDCLAGDPSMLSESYAAFESELDGLFESTSDPKLEDHHVGTFLAQFRAFNPADLE